MLATDTSKLQAVRQLKLMVPCVCCHHDEFTYSFSTHPACACARQVASCCQWQLSMILIFIIMAAAYTCWVVWISWRFDCHMNVTITVSLSPISYIPISHHHRSCTAAYMQQSNQSTNCVRWALPSWHNASESDSSGAIRGDQSTLDCLIDSLMHDLQCSIKNIVHLTAWTVWSTNSLHCW